MAADDQSQEDPWVTRQERDYRKAVLEAPKESRMPLFVAVIVPLLGVGLIADAIFGAGSEQNIVPGFLCFLVGPMLIVMQYSSLTVWVPRAGPRGFVPPKRSVLRAYRSMPPETIPWKDVREASLHAPSAMSIPSADERPALRATVKTVRGKRYTLYRRRYPQAFDAVVAQLVERRFITTWVPELSSPTPAAGGSKAADVPRGHVVLWDAGKARGRLRRAVALLVTFMASGAYLFTLIFLSFGLSSPILYVIPVGYLVWSAVNLLQAAQRLRRTVNIEVDEGRLRAPFELHPAQGGWRSTAEIRLVAVDPTPDAVRAGEEILPTLRGPGRRTAAWRRKFDTWACVGGLLIVTADELIHAPHRGHIARGVEAHWRASREA